MKKAILILFVLGFISLNGYAQKVYKKDGKVYLECTVASGMPPGSVTTDPKCKDGDGTASNSDFRGGPTNPYASENDKVFEQLEIAASDLNSKMDWKTAYEGCKKEGPGWRLPTQRELILMYIFHAPLNSMTGSAFVTSNYEEYWSSSEFNEIYSWVLCFGDGNTINVFTNKSDSRRVRCVREATP